MLFLKKIKAVFVLFVRTQKFNPMTGTLKPVPKVEHIQRHPQKIRPCLTFQCDKESTYLWLIRI